MVASAPAEVTRRPYSLVAVALPPVPVSVIAPPPVLVTLPTLIQMPSALVPPVPRLTPVMLMLPLSLVTLGVPENSNTPLLWLAALWPPVPVILMVPLAVALSCAVSCNITPLA